MGAYVNTILAPGEKVIYEGHMSKIIFIWPVALFIAGLIIGLAVPPGGFIVALVGVAYWGWVYLVWKNSEYVITNRRIVLKTGVISRKTFEMRLQKVESISFDQGIIERLLNFGTITITGTGDTTQAFRDVSDPLKFKLMAEEQMEKSQKA